MWGKRSIVRLFCAALSAAGILGRPREGETRFPHAVRHSLLSEEDVVWSWSKEEDDAVMARLAAVQDRLAKSGKMGPLLAPAADYFGHDLARGAGPAARHRRPVRRDEGTIARLLCHRRCRSRRRPAWSARPAAAGRGDLRPRRCRGTAGGAARSLALPRRCSAPAVHLRTSGAAEYATDCARTAHRLRPLGQADRPRLPGWRGSDGAAHHPRQGAHRPRRMPAPQRGSTPPARSSCWRTRTAACGTANRSPRDWR